MEDSTRAIAFDHIEKSFGSLKVLQGISGSINRGEAVAVIGSSGCGKSTLLRCFNCLETINAGRLVVNGIDLSRPNLGQICPSCLHQQLPIGLSEKAKGEWGKLMSFPGYSLSISVQLGESQRLSAI